MPEDEETQETAPAQSQPASGRNEGAKEELAPNAPSPATAGSQLDASEDAA